MIKCVYKNALPPTPEGRHSRPTASLTHWHPHSPCWNVPGQQNIRTRLPAPTESMSSLPPALHTSCVQSKRYPYSPLPHATLLRATDIRALASLRQFQPTTAILNSQDFPAFLLAQLAHVIAGLQIGGSHVIKQVKEESIYRRSRVNDITCPYMQCELGPVRTGPHKLRPEEDGS